VALPRRPPPKAHTSSVQNADKTNSTRTFKQPQLEHDIRGPCGAIIAYTTVNAASAGARDDHVAPIPHLRLHVTPSKLNLLQNELHHCKARINLHEADATRAHNHLTNNEHPGSPPQISDLSGFSDLVGPYGHLLPHGGHRPRKVRDRGNVTVYLANVEVLIVVRLLLWAGVASAT
jgi:hypothetical protein